MNKLVKEPSYNLIPERDLGKTPILECRRIGIDFGGLSAVDEFTIAIGRTEICGIIGPNGAGKTTIFNLLTNVYRPTRGSILVNGVDTLGMTTDEVNRRGVARTFQNIRLFKDLTVEENVLIGLHNSMNYSVASSMLRLPKYWKQEKEARERVRELLHIFHMENMTAQQAGSLPYGAQRRLEIVRSLATNPGILLLDEPLGALDLRLRKDMQNELKNIQQRMGITFIYVTHDQEEALTMSDTIVVMNKGKIQQIGRPEDIYNEPKNAFVADFIGESNILDGVMLEDYVVKFFGRKFQCVDKGFAPNEPVDVVIRPEDVDIVPPEQGHLCGTVTSVTFKGVHYDTIVDFKGFKWLIQTTDYCPVDAYIGIRLNPEDIHIMHKSEYSGLYGDYSSYSAEYDEIADASEEEDDEE